MRAMYRVNPPTVGAKSVPLTERPNYLPPDALSMLADQGYAYSVRPELLDQKVNALYAHYDDGALQGWTASCRDPQTGKPMKCQGQFLPMDAQTMAAYQSLRSALAPPAPEIVDEEHAQLSQMIQQSGRTMARAQQLAALGDIEGAQQAQAAAQQTAAAVASAPSVSPQMMAEILMGAGFGKAKTKAAIADKFGMSKSEAKQFTDAVSGRSVGAWDVGISGWGWAIAAAAVIGAWWFGSSRRGAGRASFLSRRAPGQAGARKHKKRSKKKTGAKKKAGKRRRSKKTARRR